MGRRPRGVPVHRERAVDSAVGHPLLPRHRRHLALARPPDDAPHADHLPRRLELAAQTSEGIRDRVPDHGSGDGRRVRRRRSDPLLHLLRADAAADVPRHRRLGRRTAGLRRDQVLPLHDRRIIVDAAGHHLPRLPVVSPDRHRHLQHHRSLRHAARAAGGDAALLRLLARLRHQSPALPTAHVASRRARRGADRRLDHPRGRDAEDGHVRFPPFRAAVLPRVVVALGDAADHALGHRHHLRRARGVGAARHEEAGRLLLGLAPRLLRARHLRHDPDRDRRLDPADGESRSLDRRAVPPRRRDLRAPPHAPPRRLRRHRQDDAGLRRLLRHRRPLLGWTPRPQRLRRRVPDSRRIVQDLSHRRDDRRHRRHPRRDLSPLARAESVLRPDHE